MTDQPAAEAPQDPVLRIVNADATPEEVAAIIAVFSALGSAPAPDPEPTSAWASTHGRLRPAHPYGPAGWRASGLPR